jgi:hypothetical protein
MSEKEIRHLAWKPGDLKALCGADLFDAICITGKHEELEDCQDCQRTEKQVQWLAEMYRLAGLDPATGKELQKELS